MSKYINFDIGETLIQLDSALETDQKKRKL